MAFFNLISVFLLAKLVINEKIEGKRLGNCEKEDGCDDNTTNNH